MLQPIIVTVASAAVCLLVLFGNGMSSVPSSGFRGGSLLVAAYAATIAAWLYWFS